MVVVASALHPQLLVTATVLTQPGTRHVLHAVPVEVSVGQTFGGAHAAVVVRVVVAVVVTVCT